MSYEGELRGRSMEPYSTEPVTLIEEVFPQDTNAYNTLFGGRLLSLMDKAGGIACAKFAHREFVTISIDTLTFIAPARQGDLLEVSGQVVYTSSHGVHKGHGLHHEQGNVGEEHHLRGVLLLRRHRFHDATHSRASIHAGDRRATGRMGQSKIHPGQHARTEGEARILNTH